MHAEYHVGQGWAALAERRPGRRYVRFLELVPMVLATVRDGDIEAIEAQMDEGGPEVELAYVGTALVQLQFARWGWIPPPAYCWTVN